VKKDIEYLIAKATQNVGTTFGVDLGFGDRVVSITVEAQKAVAVRVNGSDIHIHYRLNGFKISRLAAEMIVGAYEHV